MEVAGDWEEHDGRQSKYLSDSFIRKGTDAAI